MPRKKLKPAPSGEIYCKLRAIGAPDRLLFLALGSTFDSLWRVASIEEKVWLFRAVGREEDIELLMSEGSLAGIDGYYSTSPIPIEPASPGRALNGSIPRRIPGTPYPVRTTPLESDEFFDPPAKKAPKTRTPRTVWPTTTQSRKNAWVPPHMRPKK